MGAVALLRMKEGPNFTNARGRGSTPDREQRLAFSLGISGNLNRFALRRVLGAGWIIGLSGHREVGSASRNTGGGQHAGKRGAIYG